MRLFLRLASTARRQQRVSPKLATVKPFSYTTTAASSSSLATAATTAPLLPLKHSRKRLPPVCTDPVQLVELSQQVLEAPEGSLFTYATDKDSMGDAWDAADPVVQKVEYLVRGHAAQCKGTTWQRWVLPSTIRNNVQQQQQQSQSDDGYNHNENVSLQDITATTRHLQAMEALVDRIWDEGHAYMTVRADRMQEKAQRKLALGQKDPASEQQQQQQEEALLLDNAKDEMLQITDQQEQEFAKAMQEFNKAMETPHENDSDDEDENESEEFGLARTDNDDDDEQRPFMDDFALPGPTVDMFHTILDAMACHANSPFVTLDQTRIFWNDILTRHEVDGGDLLNSHPHTVASVLSYNAPIRVVASLPYKENDVAARDYGLLLAFEAYEALTHSELCQRNAATFTYILQTVAKYMPASRNKGNVAVGIFRMAQEEGCVDKQVLEAYQLANTPSNGHEFDTWFSAMTKQGKSPGDLPHTWRRNNKARRHYAQEATY